MQLIASLFDTISPEIVILFYDKWHKMQQIKQKNISKMEYLLVCFGAGNRMVPVLVPLSNRQSRTRIDGCRIIDNVCINCIWGME